MQMEKIVTVESLSNATVSVDEFLSCTFLLESSFEVSLLKTGNFQIRNRYCNPGEQAYCPKGFDCCHYVKCVYTYSVAYWLACLI